MGIVNLENICITCIYLVGGLEQFLFFHILGIIIIPADELIFFRGVAQPPTRYSICIYSIFVADQPFGDPIWHIAPLFLHDIPVDG